MLIEPEAIGLRGDHQARSGRPAQRKSQVVCLVVFAKQVAYLPGRVCMQWIQYMFFRQHTPVLTVIGFAADWLAITSEFIPAVQRDDTTGQVVITDFRKTGLSTIICFRGVLVRMHAD